MLEALAGRWVQIGGPLLALCYHHPKKMSSVIFVWSSGSQLPAWAAWTASGWRLSLWLSNAIGARPQALPGPPGAPGGRAGKL